MLYYLFDITATVEANEVKETFSDVFPVTFPDGTAPAAIEADAQELMDKTTDHYGEVFCYMHPCAEANVRIGLETYQLTEEEYNRFYTAYEEEE